MNWNEMLHNALIYITLKMIYSVNVSEVSYIVWYTIRLCIFAWYETQGVLIKCQSSYWRRIRLLLLL